jgi:hypothetical protein
MPILRPCLGLVEEAEQSMLGDLAERAPLIGGAPLGQPYDLLFDQGSDFTFHDLLIHSL